MEEVKTLAIFWAEELVNGAGERLTGHEELAAAPRSPVLSPEPRGSHTQAGSSAGSLEFALDTEKIAWKPALPPWRHLAAGGRGSGDPGRIQLPRVPGATGSPKGPRPLRVAQSFEEPCLALGLEDQE